MTNYQVRYASRLLPTIAVEVTTTAVVFRLTNNAFLYTGQYGVILIDIEQSIPSGTTTTLPILFESNGATQAATKVGSTPLTVADVSTGVYQFYFNKPANTLQVLSLI